MGAIYIAATSQHVGKTTSTLGLYSMLKNHGLSVGYCKPVGQKFLDIKNDKVDKDALLFAKMLEFDLVAKLHSPVILGKGATEAYIDNPDDFNFKDRIMYASKILQYQFDVVVYEGTGHPGVGSVVNLSNAQVAKMVGAGVIMVVEGGIGSTIDMLNLCLARFEEEKVPLLGVIVNKVIPDKIGKIKYYIEKYLDSKGIPLLGIMPYHPSLAYPTMRTVAKAIQGAVYFHGHNMNNKIEDILAGSLMDTDKLSSFENILLIVSGRSVGSAIAKIRQITDIMDPDKCPLSGIIITGPSEIPDDAMEYINKFEVPVVHTNLDTYGSVMKISTIEVKINTRTPWKVKEAIEMFSDCIDSEKILEIVRS
ncbi:MAG: AAA family ATPase [Bacteroidia bacterium]|nr:AAA family ATPase [Bacteroidia bacterium]